MTFEDLNLIPPILKALKIEGYEKPTPIQAQAIPPLLEGKDLLGCAQTGTGKTAAFAIPIIQLLYNAREQERQRKLTSTLILTPTRELAIQIGESFAAYGKFTGLKHAVIFGGVSQHGQTNALKHGIDILIATPGRLLDLMQQGFVDLNHIKLFVLDEADRMLDMGFVHDVKHILTKLPKQKQSLFFSATMPPEIVKLSNTILNNPVKVEVTPVSSTAETVQQALYYVDKPNKKMLLMDLLKVNDMKSVLVFARTKHGADRIARDLTKQGFKTAAIHGDKSQNARQNALNDFKAGKIRTLVATDIAARGIDIDSLSHVINYEIPNQAETYVHRIGRTGRAGANGKAISFCDAEEREYIRDIQKLIGKTIPVVEDHDYPMLDFNPAPKSTNDRRHQKKGEGQGSRPPQGNSGRKFNEGQSRNSQQGGPSKPKPNRPAQGNRFSGSGSRNK
ncbi:MAG: DEAD/DEAH box helicase [Bacteroidota bacterium]